MLRPIFIFSLVGFTANLFSQNPHGADLKIDCASCHSSAGWVIDDNYWKNSVPVKYAGAKKTDLEIAADKLRFRHEKTGFALKGQHADINCRVCHQTLVFSEASADCISCHSDMHQQTAGTDCSRCHNATNWMVDNITALHRENGFPLFGVHLVADCNACHRSESTLRFDRIGNECVNCHLDKYMATTAPDHKAAGYSTNCVDCHDTAGSDWHWSAGAANHLFFPLTKGHYINDCTQCHVGGSFLNTPTACFACHEATFQATTNPDHEAVGFSTDCNICHTTDPGWVANNYKEHDQTYFPIFSGGHDGVWNQCTACHTTSGDFKAYSCVDCHAHNNPGNLAGKHDRVSGYNYSSTACYSCHPKG